MRNSNYQTFYKDAIKNKKGYVTKDGMWAAIPSNGKKFAIVHNGIVEHFSRNFECAMIYIQKGIKKEKNARSKLNRSE
tara:strand:+ start:1223 stop:1456 length:234 start_codon:yes stop_codon:yes gene_type:complete